MFIELTIWDDNNSDFEKRMINIYSIKQMSANNDSDRHATNIHTLIQLLDTRNLLYCQETYDDVKKMIMKQKKRIKNKSNRFDLMEL